MRYGDVFWAKLSDMGTVCFFLGVIVFNWVEPNIGMGMMIGAVGMATVSLVHGRREK